MFNPDDFSDDPYTAGLNQMGHVIFGSALTLILGVYGGCAAFIAWEWFQLKWRNARKHDYFQDCFFWGAGVFMSGWYWMPVVAVLMGGTWMGATWIAQRK